MTSHHPLLIALLVSAVFATQVEARTLLKNICRVKGQEENTLQKAGTLSGKIVLKPQP